MFSPSHHRAQQAAARAAMCAVLGPVLRGGATLEEAQDRMGTALRHRPIVRRWWDVLEESGELAVDGDRARVVDLRTPNDVDRAWQAAAEQAANPVLDRFFARCSRHLTDLLTDDIILQALLFDEDGSDVTAEFYRGNPASTFANVEAARAVAACPDPLRVLEVGAGIGGTTDGVLDALRERPAAYHFTDVGRWFCDQARQRYAGRAGLSVGLCDMNGGPLTAQLTRHDHTSVLAANVLHNALDPEALLADLHHVTTPGARLVIVETGTEHHPLLISMRFLMSPPPQRPHQDFVDERRGTGRIFLSLDRWAELCERTGWNVERITPDDDHPLAVLDQRTLVATRNPHPEGHTS